MHKPLHVQEKLMSRTVILVYRVSNLNAGFRVILTNPKNQDLGFAESNKDALLN